MFKSDRDRRDLVIHLLCLIYKSAIIKSTAKNVHLLWFMFYPWKSLFMDLLLPKKEWTKKVLIPMF